MTDDVESAASREETVAANLPGPSSSGSILKNGLPKQQKRVQVVGAPPPGPPVPKDDTHSDEERVDDDGDEDEEEAKSEASDEVERSKEGEDEDVDLLADLGPDDEDVDLSHLSLKSSDLRKLNLSRFQTHLKRLVLRQNLIAKLKEDDIGSLSELTELDLYDNSLEKTYGEVLKGCPKLNSLDYSFNNIKHVSHVSHLAHLKTIYFVQNKITRIRESDFDGPVKDTLTSLELGGNKLRSIENLEKLTKLEELWLGKNKIPKLQNLDSFSSLRVLSIQSNRLTRLENLDALVGLEELYLSHNGLTSLDGLPKTLKKLRVLDIGANRITRIANEALDEESGLFSQIEEFWANDNALEDFREVECYLGPSRCPKLETVYFEGNPMQKKEIGAGGYRRRLMLMLPQVAQIDATFVKTPSLR